MNIQRLITSTAESVTEQAKKLVSDVSSAHISKDSSSIDHSALEISENYGRAISKINTSSQIETTAKEQTSLEKIFSSLEKKGKTTIKFSFANDEMDVLFFKGKHNDYFKTQDGKIFRVKYSKDEELNKTLVDTINTYGENGIITPTTFSVEINGKRGIASELITDLKDKSENPKAAYRLFGLDVLFGNRNGFNKGVTMISNSGQAVRLTSSGAGGYRVRGEKRNDFTSNISEIKTLLDRNINKESAEFLSGMTREDLLESLKIATRPIDLPNLKWEKNSAREIISKRQNNIREFWFKAYLTPQKDGESIFDYVSRIDKDMQTTLFENKKYAQELRNRIQNSTSTYITKFDLEILNKFIDKAESCNEITKALYMRNCSVDELLQFAKLEFVENKSSTWQKHISINDEPEILSKIIYSPNRTTQATPDEIAEFSKSYLNKRISLSSKEAGERSIIKYGVLDKYINDEIGFNELNKLSDMSIKAWETAKSRGLFDVIPEFNRKLDVNWVNFLSSINNESFEIIKKRPEIIELLSIKGKAVPSQYVNNILKMNDDEYKQLLERNLLNLLKDNSSETGFRNSIDLYELNKCSDEAIKNIKNRGLLNYANLYGCEIIHIAKLPEKHFQNLLNRDIFSKKNDYIARMDILAKAHISDTDIAHLKRYGINIEDWKKEEIEQIITLENPQRLAELKKYNIKHPTDTADKFYYGKKLIEKDDMIKIAQMPEKNYKRLISILNNEKLLKSHFYTSSQDKNFGIYEVAMTDDITWNNLIKRGLLNTENKPVAHMKVLLSRGHCSEYDESVYTGSTWKTIKENNESDLTLLGKISDEKWNKFINLGLISKDESKAQLTGSQLYELSKFSNEELQKALKTGIIKRNITPEDLSKNKHISTYNLKELIQTLTDDEIDTLVKFGYFKGLKSSSGRVCDWNDFDIKKIKEIANLSQEQYSALTHLYSSEQSAYTNPWVILKAVQEFNKDEIKAISDKYLISYSLKFEGGENNLEQLEILRTLVRLNPQEWNYVKAIMHLNSRYAVGAFQDAINPGKGIAALEALIKNRKNTYEFSHREKRELLQRIIHTGGIECQKEIAELTPNGTLMPKTYYKRNMLIQELIESIGLTSKKLSQEQIDDFFADLSKLASPKSGIMSTDFDKMSIKLQHKTSKPQLTYPRERFTQDTYLQISKLPIIEQRKIYDYFAFEIAVGKKGLTLTGYPTNQNNAKKLASIKNAETRKTIEKLIPLVDKFTKENKITIEGNPQLETEMNKILKVFPEFATTIGKVQHETQDFTVDVHIMKVLQCVMRDPRFEKLSDKDKQILQLSTILHDLTKLEKSVDKTHPKESAFDAYYLLDRLNLPREDKLKAYEIIKNHDWLERINKKVYDSATNAYRHLTETEKEPIMREIAFAHRQNDCYEMAKILTKADLNGVKADSKFYDLFKNAYEENSAKVQNLIDKIKETAISIPQSKIPKASELIADGEIVKSVECDGITNKVIYLKPKQDLSKVGFNTGTTSDELNVIVHALDAEEQATVFKALGFVDSDALLSSSWINYQKGNYKVFRGQGFVLKVDSDDIHAGSYKDFGSGYKKDCDTLLRKYIFGNERSQYRKYWSDEVQKKFNLTKEEYLKFNDSIKNKSFEEIKAEQPQVAQKLQEIVDEMDVWRRKGDRNYNEWLISRPEIQAGFFWGKNPDGSQKTVANVPLFIREYCAKNDLPLIFFGD